MEAAGVALRRGDPRRPPGLAIGMDIGQWTFATFIGPRLYHCSLTFLVCLKGNPSQKKTQKTYAIGPLLLLLDPGQSTALSCPVSN